MANKLHCPNCKSTNITITTESSVNGGVTAHHGSVSTTTMSNTHRNFWICSDCGTKFRNIQSLEEEIKKTKITPFILALLGVVGAIIAIFFFANAGDSIFKGFPIIMGGGAALGALIFFIMTFVSFSKTKKMEEELAYLKEKCFD